MKKVLCSQPALGIRQKDNVNPHKKLSFASGYYLSSLPSDHSLRPSGIFHLCLD